MEEGLVNKGTSAYAYEYHIKDHFGNTRVAFQPNGSSTTLTQVAEYYPFGSTYLPMFNLAGTSNKYLYNGKEKQDDVLGTGSTALDWYDYGARFYDPQIARWHSVDPLAEFYYRLSPYTYCKGNPVIFADVDGEYPTGKIVDGGRIGDRFGPRIHPISHNVKGFHSGQDFPAPCGSNVHAAADGVVSMVNYQFNPKKGTGWGEYVDITHSDGTITKYSHLQKGSISVKKGQSVKNGQIFALSGATGGVTGPHLDLEIIRNGNPIDPMTIVDLQEDLLNLDSPFNEDNPVELGEIEIMGEGKAASLQPISALVQYTQVQSSQVQSTRANAYNTSINLPDITPPLAPEPENNGRESRPPTEF